MTCCSCEIANGNPNDLMRACQAKMDGNPKVTLIEIYFSITSFG